MSKNAAGVGASTWFVVADEVPQEVVDAAIRAALVAQRERLGVIQIDICSDDEWPAEVLGAVAAAERRLRAKGSRSITLDLDPRSDDDFDIAVALAPVTVGGTGLGAEGRYIWDANDTGTSAAFDLTPAEERQVRAAVAAAGGAPEHLTTLSSHHLSRRALTYGPVGGTAPAAERWISPSGYRVYERTVRLGEGTAVWDATSAAVLSWGVKTGSGFSIEPSQPLGRAIEPGERFWLVAHLGPVRVREPVEVVATVATESRAGFAYGTLTGHPVSGEEAFIVHRDEAARVWLTLRSLTGAGRGPWRLMFPLALVAQRVYRRRYLGALRDL